MEDELVQREKKIFAILEQEQEDGAHLASAARKMMHFLLLEKKGYAAEEVERSVIFTLTLGAETAHSSVDFLVTLNGKKAMVVKCSAGSLDSRERQAVAAARLLSVPPVPFAVVSDPEHAEFLDTATGKVIGEGFGAVPVREELLKLLADIDAKPLAPERIEKEKRILLAFDAIRCCVPQGADGRAIQIGEACEKKKT
jgi:hypothetical protein